MIRIAITAAFDAVLATLVGSSPSPVSMRKQGRCVEMELNASVSLVLGLSRF